MDQHASALSKEMNRLIILFVVSMLMSALPACILPNTAERLEHEQFVALFDADDVNRTISMNELTESDLGFNSDGTIVIEIRNNSRMPVRFSSNFGLEGLAYLGPEVGWRSIPNVVHSPDGGRILGPIGSDIPSISVAYFEPGHVSDWRSSTLRLVAQGTLAPNGIEGDKRVLAFIDVHME